MGLALMLRPLILLMPTRIRGSCRTMFVSLVNDALAVDTCVTIRSVARTLLLAEVRLATMMRLSRLLLRIKLDVSTVLSMQWLLIVARMILTDLPRTVRPKLRPVTIAVMMAPPVKCFRLCRDSVTTVTNRLLLMRPFLVLMVR